MRRRRKLLWLLFALILGLVIVGFVQTLKKGTSELPVYTRAASRMLDGEAIYRPGEEKPFTYPPFFALPFVPLARLPEGLARALWYLTNVAFLFGILLILSRVMRPQLRAARRQGRGPPAWVFWLVVGVLAARHVAAVFSNQSHDLIVFGAIAMLIASAARRRSAYAGTWAGVGAACKATPLLFAPIFFWQKRFVAGLFCLVATVGLVLLPDLVCEQANGKLWVVSWYESFLSKLDPGQAPEAAGAWSPWNILNQNLAGSIYRLSRAPGMESAAHFDVSLWQPSDQVLKGVTYGAQAAILLMLAFATRASLTHRLATHELAYRRLGEVGLVCSAMLLLSPMSSKSHFCVLLVPITFCAADFFYRKRDPIVGAFLVLILATGTLASKGIWGSHIGNEILARGSVMFCALCAFLACAHVLWHRRAHGRREAKPASGAELSST